MWNLQLFFTIAVFVIFVVSNVILVQGDVFGTVQAAAARGKLMCNGKPSVGTKVKLYDEDSKRI